LIRLAARRQRRVHCRRRGGSSSSRSAACFHGSGRDSLRVARRIARSRRRRNTVTRATASRNAPNSIVRTISIITDWPNTALLFGAGDAVVAVAMMEKSSTKGSIGLLLECPRHRIGSCADEADQHPVINGGERTLIEDIGRRAGFGLRRIPPDRRNGSWGYPDPVKL
jgi:hypothetical protein